MEKALSTPELVVRVEKIPADQRLAFDNKLRSIERLEQNNETELHQQQLDRDRIDLDSALKQAGH